MSQEKYATLVAKLQGIAKYLETAQFSHGCYEDGNYAANEAAGLIKKAIEESENTNGRK